jgi:hypothetical protein
MKMAKKKEETKNLPEPSPLEAIEAARRNTGKLPY